MVWIQWRFLFDLVVANVAVEVRVAAFARIGSGRNGTGGGRGAR